MLGQNSQTVLFILNPIQAGVFCYHMCLTHPLPPFLPPNLVLQFSEIKPVKGSNSQIHNDVIFPLAAEHSQKMLSHDQS